MAELEVSGGYSRGSGLTWRLAGRVSFQAHVCGYCQDSPTFLAGCWTQGSVPCWLLASGTPPVPCHTVLSIRQLTAWQLASLRANKWESMCPRGSCRPFVTWAQNWHPIACTVFCSLESHKSQPSPKRRELHSGVNTRQQWPLGACHTLRLKTEEEGIRKYFMVFKKLNS